MYEYFIYLIPIQLIKYLLTVSQSQLILTHIQIQPSSSPHNNLNLMKLTSLYMQGFKTMREPTFIGDIDPGYNAIVGKNGSGKTNILDALNFVLGGVSKQRLRITNSLNEVIANGPGTPAKTATVTMQMKVTDQSLKHLWCQGKEDLIVSRTISKTEGSKFKVNGRFQSMEYVKEMFSQLNLNVDFPQFMVKQGQIVALATMKPLALLQMLEEPLGTANHVSERDGYLKEQAEIDEVLKKSAVLLEKNGQMLKSLEESKEQFQGAMEQKKVVEALKYKVHSFEYLSSDQKRAQIDEQIKQLQEKKTLLNEEVQSLSQKIQSLEQTISNIKQEQKSFSKFEVELRAEEEKKDLKVREQRQVQEQLDAFKNQCSEARIKVFGVEEDLEKRKKTLESLKTEKARVECDIRNVQADLLSYNSKSNEKALVESQIAKNTQKLKQLKLEHKDLKVEQKNLTEKIASQATRYNEVQNVVLRLAEDERKLKEEIQELARVEKPPHEHPEYSQNTQKMRAIQREMKSYDKLMVIFNRQTPPDFDKSQILQKVGFYINVRQEEFITALEIGAQGLLQIVVTSSSVAALAFRSNVVINPTSFVVRDVSYSSISANQQRHISECQKRYGGAVHYPLDLIDYDRKFDNVVRYALQGFVIVETDELAKAICTLADRSLRVKCVTFAGNKYTVDGVMSGGDNQSGQAFHLKSYRKMRVLDTEYRECKLKQEALSAENAKNEELKRRYYATRDQITEMAKQLNKIQRELKEVKERNREYDQGRELLEGSIQPKLKGLEDEIKAVEEFLERFKSGNGNLEKEKQRLTGEVKRKQQILVNLEKQEVLVRAQKDELEVRRKKYNQLISGSAEQHVQDLESSIQKLEEEIDELKGAIDEMRMKCEERSSPQHLEKLKQNELLMAQMLARMKLLWEQQKDDSREMELKGRMDSVASAIKSIEKQHTWVRAYVVENGVTLDSYPTGYNINAELDLKTAAECKYNMMFEKGKDYDEEFYQALLSSRKKIDEGRQTMLQMKQKMHELLRNLDQKRIRTIQHGYILIQERFRAIFSHLHPGINVDLVFKDREDIFKGLKIVARKDGQKLDVMEFSGGQKTLVSLSFIFANLMLQPCPFYCLDEVDAALDGRNGVRIGSMLAHFYPNTQFLVITHKPGMEAYAKVMYKVQFKNHVSVIERLACSIQAADMLNSYNSSVANFLMDGDEESQPQSEQQVMSGSTHFGGTENGNGGRRNNEKENHRSENIEDRVQDEADGKNLRTLRRRKNK